ncbi:MtrAB system histidine kinase MtrB [Streptacidiphilus cavernicola]|uniref:Sensor histidine kinase MtrB n=1 Tax=Streptacidiphilus cavernicola TaxID=3342716 RepID=A0ABV6VZR8_9ACTN
MSGQTPAAPGPVGGRSTVSGTNGGTSSGMDEITDSGATVPESNTPRRGFVAVLAGIRALCRRLTRRFRRPVRRFTGLYRRSIQLRVVATTLVLSLGVVLLLGVVVVNQVRNGLLKSKVAAATVQAQNGFKAANEQLGGGASTHGNTGTPAGGQQPATTSDGQIDLGSLLADQVKFLATSGAGQYAVVGMVPGTDQTKTASSNSGSRNPRVVGNVDPDRTIGQDLRNRVHLNAGQAQSAYTTIYYADNPPTPSEAGLIVGAELTIPVSSPTTGTATNQTYQLYYVFPFTLEGNTLSLVTTTLLTAGIFVVILLGAISWLVVRQVVTPVRMAAEISERLADGRLDERMKVTGTDDIARLGESFNRMGAALQTQIRQLEELSRVQRRFVSDVSHELRTPLTTVRMAADLLYESRGDFGDAAAERSAELLQNQLDRFESLLADLLEISRFDAGAAILDAEPADLRDVVGRVIEAAEPLAATKGSSILVRGADEPVVAEVDPRRIERILRNLVVNALEHGEGRDIEVRLAAGDGAVAVAVRDQGIGLKPGEASRVFNRFWRADPARARTTGGTGLGLSIALEDAALHGGWLHAWGEPGGGSQFRLTVPRNAGAEITRSPIPLEPDDSRGNRGLAVSGMPYMRASRPIGATALGGEPSDDAAMLGTGLGPGLGGVLGYGSVIPGVPGRTPLPPSKPSDVRAASGYGATGAQVVVSKEGRDEDTHEDE